MTSNSSVNSTTNAIDLTQSDSSSSIGSKTFLSDRYKPTSPPYSDTTEYSRNKSFRRVTMRSQSPPQSPSHEFDTTSFTTETTSDDDVAFAPVFIEDIKYDPQRVTALFLLFDGRGNKMWQHPSWIPDKLIVKWFFHMQMEKKIRKSRANGGSYVCPFGRKPAIVGQPTLTHAQYLKLKEKIRQMTME